MFVEWLVMNESLFINQRGLCKYEGFFRCDSILHRRGSGLEHILQMI